MHTATHKNHSKQIPPKKTVEPVEALAQPLFDGVYQIQRKSCACGGGCPNCKSDEAMQTKLAVSKPGDAYEREADHVADQITNSGSSGEKASVNKAIKVSSLQRQAESNSKNNSVPNSVSETLSGSGKPLDAGTRSTMEPYFEKDFSNVRVHTGEKASESSSDVNAKAYTVGTDIVFNENQYAPGTKEGDRLLAHELTHVVQQNGDLSRSVLQRDENDTPVPQQEGGDKEPEDGPEPEDDEDEDDAEDGDTDVSDVTEYPEQPEIPYDIGHGPEPMPVKPGGESATPENETPAVGSDSGAEEMGGKLPKAKISSIEVDQVKQKMTIHFNGAADITHAISTGRGECGTKDDPCKSQNNHNCTPNGTFTITGQGNANTKNPKGDAMAWFVGLAVKGRKGIGIHNSQPVPGIPHSHGCVRTGNAKQDGGIAEMINKGVTYGKTKVTIQGKAATKPYPCPKKKSKKKGTKK